MFFLFKQKTAYEMRISDWSSDVCSSDLYCLHIAAFPRCGGEGEEPSSMTVISDVDYVAHPDPRLPFSAAVRVGDVVHLSGQIGVREDGTLPDDIAGQAHQAMRNLADAADRKSTRLNSSH